jgi:DnaJ homolog subfamily A member 2
MFTRKGADLYYDKEISLLEALTAVDFTIMHLDGRMVRVQNEAGKVIKPNSTMTCEGLGMPFHKTPYKFGNLFINFKIKFPESMETEQISAVKNVLSGQKSEQNGLEEATETVQLIKFEEHHKHIHASGEEDPHEQDEGDDDEGQGQPGCQA